MPDSDEKTFLSGHTSVENDRPLAHLAEVENRTEAADGPDVLGDSTEDRLRAFENDVLGEKHLRHKGQPEKGVGSPFAAMSDKQKAHHAALEALIAAEKEHQAATTAEGIAHAKLESAITRVEETEEAL